MLEETNFNVPEAAWVLNKLKSDDFCVPYSKRFGSIVQFVNIWVQIRFDVQKFYNPSRWTNSPDEPKDAGDEEWVDIGKVTGAIMGEDFGAMAVTIFASNQPVEEIRMFSRGCPCHRNSFMANISSIEEHNAHGVEEDSVLSYCKRMKAMARVSGVSHPCVAKGLVLPFFAVGDHEVIMREARAYQRQLLWREMTSIAQHVRDANMAAFDKCTDHIIYNVTLKMSDFMVLPLKLAGLHHPMQSRAAEAAAAVLAQWDRTKAKVTLHHQRTLALFNDEVAVRELGEMATDMTSDIDKLPTLNSHVAPIAIAKGNELSVERLHHLGKMASDHAGNVGPVYVSCSLT